MQRNIRYLIWASVALSIQTVHAEESVTPSSTLDMIKFSGFGTLGVAHSSEYQADFVNKINLPKGAGHSRKWSFNSDTRIGVQVDAMFNEMLSATLQVQSQQNYDNTYNPKIEWANLKLQVTPQLTVTAGRMGLPLFMLSDYINVGYAQYWLRSPNTVYFQVPFSHIDGAELSYQFNLGEVVMEVQALYGNTDAKLATSFGTNRGDIKSLWGGVFNTEFGKSTVRLSHFQSNHGFSVSSTESDNLFNFYRTLNMTNLANQYEVKNHAVSFTGLGYSYDTGLWFLQTEATRVTGDDDYSPHSTSWYASAGYRFEKLTTYMTFGEITIDNSAMIGDADPIGGIDQIKQFGNSGQQTISLGARWDFKKNMDLKVQLDHVNLKQDSYGGLVNVQPEFHTGSSFNILSFAFDVVF